MNLLFTKAFSKDLDKIDDAGLKEKLAEVLEQLEKASSLTAILHIKKLKGSKTAYRIRIGDHRLGFLLTNSSTLTIASFVHRKDIYQVFP